MPYSQVFTRELPNLYPILYPIIFIKSPYR